MILYFYIDQVFNQLLNKLIVGKQVLSKRGHAVSKPPCDLFISLDGNRLPTSGICILMHTSRCPVSDKTPNKSPWSYSQTLDKDDRLPWQPLITRTITNRHPVGGTLTGAHTVFSHSFSFLLLRFFIFFYDDPTKKMGTKSIWDFSKLETDTFWVKSLLAVCL